jgi:hypothetical protein
MAGSKKAQELAEQLLGVMPGASGAAIAEGALNMDPMPAAAQYGLGINADFYMKNKKAIMIGGGFLAFALIGGIGYYLYQKSHKGADDKPL